MAETRIEYADKRQRKGAGRRLVKRPGEARHVATKDSAETIARKILLDRAERRLKRAEAPLGR